MPLGSGIYSLIVARAVDGAGQYAAVLRVEASGAASVYVVRRSASYVDTALSKAASVGTITAGQQVRVRVRAVGTGPTAVSARAWLASAAEPTSLERHGVRRDVGVAGARFGRCVELPVLRIHQRPGDAVRARPVGVDHLGAPADAHAHAHPDPHPDPTLRPGYHRATRWHAGLGLRWCGGHRQHALRGTVRRVVVATNGSDTAAGTLAAPLATVTRALAIAPSGGTIVLRGGTYHEAV